MNLEEKRKLLEELEIQKKTNEEFWKEFWEPIVMFVWTSFLLAPLMWIFLSFIQGMALVTAWKEPITFMHSDLYWPVTGTMTCIAFALPWIIYIIDEINKWKRRARGIDVRTLEERINDLKNEISKKEIENNKEKIKLINCKQNKTLSEKQFLYI